jgi:hypothetical protein
MTSKSGRKPKFRVGQVVAIREGYMGEGEYHRIESFMMSRGNKHLLFAGMAQAVEWAVRPLTKLEAGR